IETLALPGHFELGQARLLHTGTQATIVAVGLLVPLALQAAAELAAENCRVRVLDLSTIKPLDTNTILRAAQTTGAILVAEEHQLIGGAGSQIATYLSHACPVPMDFLAVNDKFGQSGTAGELFAAYGLTKDALKEKVRQLIISKDKTTKQDVVISKK
ncbi:MAG: transketolase C-terminal domain-containing protein, partial [bacterium]|nr:transketolase C-terminal domain-containing protein [bacterium]